MGLKGSAKMPVCFMIMPYGRKPTQAEPGRGPAEIDFNALWDRGYVPVIKELGYEPVRADQDTGGLIIGQVLERLYFADLVLADMTIPNGNVWWYQLFDVVQMRSVCAIRFSRAITLTTTRLPPCSPRSGMASWRFATGSRQCTSRSRAIQKTSIQPRRPRLRTRSRSLGPLGPKCQQCPIHFSPLRH